MTAFKGNEIEIGAKMVWLPWPILSAIEVEDKVVVFLDPNAYLNDPTYLSELKNGKESIRNMIEKVPGSFSLAKDENEPGTFFSLDRPLPSAPGQTKLTCRA